jgi:enoyl-[acyl-carrier protein] reductase II
MKIEDYQIIGGAMTWVSNPNLVAAISNEGALGILATGSMNAVELDFCISETKKLTNEIFGVNLIMMNPDYDNLIRVCADHKIKVVVLGAAMPRKEKIDDLKSIGAFVFGFASSLKIANAMIKNGIDAIILEGNEAGGHVGPIATQVLVQEILFNIKNFPIFIAGGIGCGRIIKHYMNMGAAGCQLGSRFVCAYESPMHPQTKKIYISKQAKDTCVVSSIDPVFPVIPVRVIRNNAVNEFYKKQNDLLVKLRCNQITTEDAVLGIEKYWVGSLKRGVIDGDIENGSLMAGQSISFVNKEESVRDIIKNLKDEYEYK